MSIPRSGVLAATHPQAWLRPQVHDRTTGREFGLALPRQPKPAKDTEH